MSEQIIAGEVPEIRFSSYSNLSRAEKVFADMFHAGTQFAAFSIGSYTLILNSNLPEHSRLMKLCRELMHCRLLDDNDEKGFKLLSEIEAAWGRRVCASIYQVWQHWRSTKAREEANKEARRFLSDINLEESPDCSYEMLSALYSQGRNGSLDDNATYRALRAVFLYGFYMASDTLK